MENNSINGRKSKIYKRIETYEKDKATTLKMYTQGYISLNDCIKIQRTDEMHIKDCEKELKEICDN